MTAVQLEGASEPLISGESADTTVRQLIDRMAIARAKEIFLFSPETRRALTFSDLQEQSRAVWRRLQQAGLEPGQKIAFLLDNGLFTVQLFLGTMYSGLISVPLNVRAGVAQLTFTLNHCDAGVVFVEDQYQALLEEALAGVERKIQVIPTNVDSFATDCVAFDDNWLPPIPASEDAALLMYTSGSVGQPKAAIHSHRTLLAHGRNSQRSHQLTFSDRSLLVLPVYHINAECVTLMPTLTAGGSVVVPHRFEVSRFWNLLHEYRCTWSAVVPTIVSQLLDWKQPDLRRREGSFEQIRFIRSSSAPLSPSLQREFIGKFNLRLIQAMGSSECGNIFSNPQAPAENKIGTPGLAWGFETRIVDPDGNDVARGETGEVLLRGPATMHGYYKDPEGTALVLDRSGWLHTGDLAYQDEDGYFFVVGRSKELIIKAGMNIAPRQVDEILEAHPSVLEAAVVGIPDRHLGEDLIAFVVLRSGMTGDEGALLAFCEAQLGHFKTPTRIHFVNDLPKGPSGKVQRLRLLDGIAAVSNIGALNGNSHAANGAWPRETADLEMAIAQCWSAVLKQSVTDHQSNFFSLGGHSLMAVQCLSLIREKLLIALSLTDFFDTPTITGQAALVAVRHSAIEAASSISSPGQISAPIAQTPSHSENHALAAPGIVARGANLPYALSSGQQRIWFFEEFAPEVPLYNESEAVRLRGELHVDALEHALNLVVSRHEILRTTIKIVQGAPTATVHESSSLKLKRIDLSGLKPDTREAEVKRLLVEEPRIRYELAVEPGIRATLIHLAPGENLFILMMHHLVCDWASEGVLWRELSTAYYALTHGRPPELPPLPIQFGDYATWQQQRVALDAFHEDLDFWEEKLRGAPELLELPTDRPRASMQTYRGTRERFSINAPLTAALRDFSRQESTTLFTVFAAAFNALLHRYTGCEDILIGIPLSERDRPELQPLIGFLLHIQVLRTRLSSDLTFSELLARSQKELLDLYQHRGAPFDQIVNCVHPERTRSQSPLFQVMMNWRDRDQDFAYIGLEGLEIDSALAESGTSKFDLTLLVTDYGETIALEMEYNTDLFDRDRIVRMFGHYQTLLEGVVNDPSCRLGDLPLILSAERNQLLIEWNQTDSGFPSDMCIHDLFEQQVERTPDATALVFEERCLSFRQLNDRANAVAQQLRNLDVVSSEMVGLCTERSIEMMIGLLGILKAGAAYVPMDPAYPKERLAFVREDSGARIILTQRHLLDRLDTQRVTLVELDSEIRDTISINPLPASNGSGTLAYVMYTSGSTGTPKGVMVEHRNVVNFFTGMDQVIGIETGVWLAVTSISFDISVLELLWTLTRGFTVILQADQDKFLFDGEGSLSEQVRKYRITHLQCTPTYARMLLQAPNAVGAMTSLRKLLLGGESLPPSLAGEISRHLDADVYNMYGPTETTVWSTAHLVGKEEDPISIGRPIANTKIFVLDDHRRPVPVGTVGELYVGGAGVARGYWKRPELTAERFVANPFSGNSNERLYKTGDLVSYRPDGLIDFHGRTDHQLKLRGFRIELGEIEFALKQHPDVSDCVVVVKAGEGREQRLVGYFVPNDPGRIPSAESLQELVKQKLPAYMIPAVFVALDQIPTTPNLKIDRNALPAFEKNAINSDTGYVAPNSPLEHALARTWREFLRRESIGVTDDFFALGGHSLLASRMVAEVHSTLGYGLSLPAFFRAPTIESMARLIEHNIQGQHHPQLIPLKPRSSFGSVFFLDAGIGLCRLAELLDDGISSFATAIPLPEDAIRAARLHRLAELPSLESMAAAHVALIRTQLRSGPRVLAGHSYGGLYAFEVAHQLLSQGIEVDLIVLLDSWARPPLFQQKLKRFVLDGGLLAGRVRYLFSRVREAVAENGTTRVSGAKNSVGSLPPLGAETAFGEVPGEVLPLIYRNARRSYRFQRLDCRAVLLHSEYSNAAYYKVDGKMSERAWREYAMGWGGLFSELEVVETSGDHMSMLQQPHLTTLAEKINQQLHDLLA